MSLSLQCNLQSQTKELDTKQGLPSPTFNVDNQDFFLFLLEKTRYFPALIRGMGDKAQKSQLFLAGIVGLQIMKKINK